MIIPTARPKCSQTQVQCSRTLLLMMVLELLPLAGSQVQDAYGLQQRLPQMECLAEMSRTYKC